MDLQEALTGCSCKDNFVTHSSTPFGTSGVGMFTLGFMQAFRKVRAVSSKNFLPLTINGQRLVQACIMSNAACCLQAIPLASKKAGRGHRSPLNDSAVPLYVPGIRQLLDGES